MATRAKLIRNFFKKFFGIDAKGMSEVAVLRDVIKKKYDVDANGGSVVELLQDVISNNDELVDEAATGTVDPCAVFSELKQLVQNNMSQYVGVMPFDGPCSGWFFVINPNYVCGEDNDTLLPAQFRLVYEPTSDYSMDLYYEFDRYSISFTIADPSEGGGNYTLTAGISDVCMGDFISCEI